MGITEWVTAREAEAGQGAKRKLLEDLRAVVADAEELVKATANQSEGRIAAVRAKAEESVKAAKARLVEQEAAMMAKTRKAAKAADDYVRDHHWQAVGIAGVVGLVIGLLGARLGLLEAGEKVIIRGGRSIQGVGKEVQKFFQ